MEIHKIKIEIDNFSFDEIAEVCYEYLAQFSEKTKEETKEKSLKKYLTKEF